ncbi:MAG TPA: DUF305 domain-containing protein [Streptosporangiaceae bacterium]
MRIPCGGLAVVTVASLAAAITACGSAGTPASSPSPRPPAAYNTADLAFTRTMMVLQDQAGQITALPAGRAATGQVRRYAATVRDQARASQQTMLGWLHSWHRAAPARWSPGAAAPYPMGPQMMRFTGWTRYWTGTGHGWHALAGLRGPAFDTAWTAMMARGYAAQLALARQELRHGTSPWARRLALAMITRSQTGLTRMQSWYRTWGGPNWDHPRWWNQWDGWNWQPGRTQHYPVRNHRTRGQQGRWNGWNSNCGCW